MKPTQQDIIDPATLNPARMVALLLYQRWHKECDIVLNWRQDVPGEVQRPQVIIRHNNGTEYPAYLRYSKGPLQGFFWDSAPDDFQQLELAILALSKAPYPRSVAPVVFKLNLKGPQ